MLYNMAPTVNSSIYLSTLTPPNLATLGQIEEHFLRWPEYRGGLTLNLLSSVCSKSNLLTSILDL